MRIKVQLELNTNWLIKDYRTIFMSFIKKVFENYDPVLLTQLYGAQESPRKINKPFTFHPHFPEFSKFESNRILCGKKVSFYFSSSDEILATAFYNGLHTNKQILIGNNSSILFNVGKVWIEPNKKFNDGSAIFKTVAPVLVNKKGDNLKYLAPVDEGFGEAFRKIIILQSNTFNIEAAENNIDFEIMEMKKITVSHFRQTMTGWLGKFVLKAPKEVLQLVYDTGIGVRRSQGFGMLEKI